MKDLRSKLCIIPQESTLFKGTLRSNIDPFNEYEDKELWNVVEKSHLLDIVNKLEGKLDCKVEESGKNFSVGQRKLICKKNKKKIFYTKKKKFLHKKKKKIFRKKKN